MMGRKVSGSMSVVTEAPRRAGGFVSALPLLCVLLVSCVSAAGCRGTLAKEETSTPYNQIVVRRPGDVSFLKTPRAPGQLTMCWQVCIPWSHTGLGQSDRYWGQGEGGVPLNGGAFPPTGLIVGPGPVIAVDTGGGTRLYDSQGRFLGDRPGSPAGFLPDGSLVGVGGKPMVVARAPDGTTVWGRDPWSEVTDRLLGGRTAQGYGLPPVVSPAGETWFYMHLSPDSENLKALVVYGPAGDTRYCDRVPEAASLLFTPQGTCFSSVVGTERGDACREFRAGRGEFTLVRTVTLPSGAGWIRAVGQDGSLLCRDADGGRTLIESYTLYRPGAKTALTFSLPEGHNLWSCTPDGRIYTTQLLRDFFVVTAWIWPTR